ncbi:MAG: methyltransferase domain-containing protein [Deltaproteobacteria bacterium]|jgi:predicted methyltransferase|nr:methyltransferase domain-containing protein [Deltaproteobacteria bacterium]MBW2541815.1 methyltransferase domain-containing protein [Deltaproteobacteria bacterium]
MRFTDAIRRNALSISLLGLSCLAVAGASGARAPAKPGEDSVRPGVNERFLSQDLDVAEFVEIFEGESREVSVHRERIARALEVSAGMQVADIGAGTGLFLPDFDRAVGAEGRVYAVEIAPKFLAHLRERAEREKLARVEVVEGREDAVALPAASVDLAFVCDTYHHFEYPRSTLASLYSAIRPGGSLVILDFERIPGKSSKWVMEHVRAGKREFRREIEAAGFEFEREIEVEGLKENYVIRFRRP